jgi:glutaryl-CoA dehydrogenase (non-decarboxylating)
MSTYDIEITKEHEILRQVARDFVEKEIRPVVDEDERNHRFQRDIVSKMGDLGFFGCVIPEEYGGSGMGFLAHAIVTEEIARVSGSLRAPFNMQAMGTAREILQYGNEEQKKKYIPGLVKGELLGCIGITEPDAGSDVASLKTTAVKKGDYYVLNGSKTWITWATVADTGIFYAYTDRSKKYRGISAFIVDLHSPGVTTRLIEHKMGWHACPTGEVFFEDVKVPAENLMGNEGEGFFYAMGGLDNTRLSAAAGAIGVCRAIIEESVKYATQRKQFGQEIGQFQMVQEMIARMVVETEAARLLVYRCACEKDRGVKNTLETSMAKYYSCDVASRVADLGLLILGAYGYSGEYPMERYLRDAKLYQLIEGSPNIHKIIIANDVLGYKKANR